MVLKVAGGHNCWLSSPQACADILTTWISNWAGGGSGRAAARRSQLHCAAVDRRSGATKVFPADSDAVQPAPSIRCVQQFCSRCHSPIRDHAAVAVLRQQQRRSRPTPRRRPKINLNTPTTSRFYVRLAHASRTIAGPPRQPGDCPASAAIMLCGDPGLCERHRRHAGRSDAGGVQGADAVRTARSPRATTATMRDVDRQVGVQGRHRHHRLRHQRRGSGHEPDAHRQYHLGRRLGRDLRHRRRGAQASTATSSQALQL